MSTFDTKRVGGSLSINLEKSGQVREIVLTSTDALTTVQPSSPRVWRRATRADSFLAIPAMASIVFFIQHNLGGSGTIPGGAHDNLYKKVRN